MLILSILLPVLLGVGILLKGEFKSRNTLLTITGAGLAATAALALGVVFGEEAELMGIIDEKDVGSIYVLPGSHSKIIYTDEVYYR